MSQPLQAAFHSTEKAACTLFGVKTAGINTADFGSIFIIEHGRFAAKIKHIARAFVGGEIPCQISVALVFDKIARIDADKFQTQFSAQRINCRNP